MKCVICRNGEAQPGTATVTLERDGSVLVVKGVPASICENCGEEFLDEAVSSHLLEMGEESVRNGEKVNVRDYVAA